jgi:hypothetical protein
MAANLNRAEEPIREPSLADLSAFAREHLGLSLEDDPEAMAQLAAIGLTIRAWRNTSLEDLHAGNHPSGGFPDSDMMRFNIVTFRVVSKLVSADGIAWEALRSSLADPDRPLPGGRTVGALAGDEFEQLATDIQESLEVSEWTEQHKGFAYLLTFLAIQGGTSYKGWYGSPWWADVDVFIELLADRASAAWRHDDRGEPEPASVSDRKALRRTLLEEPEALDDDGIYWCLSHGLARQATFRGYARWRRRRDPAWTDPMPWLSKD